MTILQEAYYGGLFVGIVTAIVLRKMWLIVLEIVEENKNAGGKENGKLTQD